MKTIKRLLWLFLFVSVMVNAVAIMHAYRFTHFADDEKDKTNDAKKLTTVEKLKTLVSGVKNPRPENVNIPSHTFETISLKSKKKIEGWLIPAKSSKGTIILFHGFSGDKSKMLDKAELFMEMGFNTLLIDFMGSGGSEGNQTTIGFREAEQVKASFEFLKKRGTTDIYLFGTSMGAVAILKAIKDYGLQPKGIILECPFGTMYKTTEARFKIMNIPPFPMADLLVLWGGLINGFWAFNHNPIEYAKTVQCSTLLLYGEKDEKVSRDEIDQIFHNLKGEKQLKTYPLAGHENYLRKYKNEWINDVKKFLLR